MSRKLLPLAAAALILLYLVTRPQPQPPRFRLAPLTFDIGVTTDPALSPDAHFLAYVSDRDSAQSLDLYIQEVPTGTPRRLTQNQAVSQPAFSADSRTIYYCAQNSIYAIPREGGTPRLIAANAANPRPSPVGDSLAYSTAAGVVAPQTRIAGARYPAWSPDGKSILYRGVDDFYTIPANGGQPASTHLIETTRKAGLADPIDDLNWTPDGIFFTARAGFTRNLYRFRPPHTLDPITNGTTLADHASAAAQAGQFAFADTTQRFNLWTLALDPRTGRPTGPPVRLTDTTALPSRPTISPDGRTLEYHLATAGSDRLVTRPLSGQTQPPNPHRYTIQNGTIYLDRDTPIFQSTPRLSLEPVNPATQSLAATPGKLIFILAETQTNIWLAGPNP